MHDLLRGELSSRSGLGLGISLSTHSIVAPIVAPHSYHLPHSPHHLQVSTGIIFSRPKTAKGIIVFCCFGLIAALLLPYLVYQGLKKRKGKLIYMAFGCSLLMAFVNIVMFIDQLLTILNVGVVEIGNYASPCEDVKYENKLECENGVYRSSGIAVAATFIMIFLSAVLCRASYRYNRLGYSSQSNLKMHKAQADDFSEEYKQTEEYKQNYAGGANPVV